MLSEVNRAVAVLRRASKKRGSARGGAALPLVCSGGALFGIVALLVFVLYMTFVPGLPTEPGFTLRHWGRALDSRLWTTVIPNTLIVGFGAILVASFLPYRWRGS